MDGWKLVALSVATSCARAPQDTDAGESTTDGAHACGESGNAIASLKGQSSGDAAIAGDIDGDGHIDAVFGLRGGFDGDGHVAGPGRVRIVLGPLEHRGGSIDDQPGFSILAEHDEHAAENTVLAAGDVNGDGLGDVFIAAMETCGSAPCEDADETGGCRGECSPGPFRAYIVFGKTDSSDVELAEVVAGIGGFAIEHSEQPNELASQVPAALGDVDADGLADVGIGAGNDRVYVVRGRADTTMVDLAAIEAGVGGFSIAREAVSGTFPTGVSGAGDIDGDGADDILVHGDFDDEDPVYVVFGGEAGSHVELADVAQGIGGFTIRPELEAVMFTSIASVGDIDGDGLSEVGLGAAYGEPSGSTARAYVVHGKSDTLDVDLTDVADGIGGFAIDGFEGRSTVVAGGHDYDGDGVPDVLVSDFDPEEYSTGAFVVAGKSGGALVRLGEPGTTAVLAPEGLYWGITTESLVSDLDCDGRAEVMFRRPLGGELAFVLD